MHFGLAGYLMKLCILSKYVLTTNTRYKGQIISKLIAQCIAFQYKKMFTR